MTSTLSSDSTPTDKFVAYVVTAAPLSDVRDAGAGGLVSVIIVRPRRSGDGTSRRTAHAVATGSRTRRWLMWSATFSRAGPIANSSHQR